ncbi:ABC transporter ATP-binding protein [Glutamicibacter halophytocola]|uniref:ABC transporter ATP-binding protein n=1 Tax=Glutamicibacter halophytocola TaxID=1933880 RepID=UPI00321B8816
MISATDVSAGYGGGLVVRGVGLQADHGEVVGLIGPNGGGKSTFLRTLYAALPPRTGLVALDHEPISEPRGNRLARRVAVVAQESPSELPASVADMVLLGRAPQRRALAAFTREDHQAVAAALSRVGARELANRRYATLSGGEKQRVLVARTLAQQADHLLLDEPTNHLDIRYQHELLRLVGQLGGHHRGGAPRPEPRRPVLRQAGDPQGRPGARRRNPARGAHRAAGCWMSTAFAPSRWTCRAACNWSSASPTSRSCTMRARGPPDDSLPVGGACRARTCRPKPRP